MTVDPKVLERARVDIAAYEAGALDIDDRYLVAARELIRLSELKAVANLADRVVTRFELIDHRSESIDQGRRVTIYDALPMRVEQVFQDDGRTCKVFLSDGPPTDKHQ